MKTLSFLFLTALTISFLPNQTTAQSKEVPPKIVHIEKGQQARTLTVQLANLLGARTEIFLLDGRQVKKILSGNGARPEGRLVAQFEAAGPRLLTIRLANLRRQPASVDVVSLDGASAFGADSTRYRRRNRRYYL